MCSVIPGMQIVFYAKRWYYYVLAFVFTGLSLFSAIMGPLFLFDVLKRADGKPGTEAGVALSIIAVPLGLAACLFWFNVLARRRPLLRICREGVEVNVIGATSLDGVRLLHPFIRTAWAILSMQGFRKQIGWVTWEVLRGVYVENVSMSKVLLIDAPIVYSNRRGGHEPSARIGDRIAFVDADFREPLDRIASTIRALHDDPDTRQELPSFDD